MENKTNLPGELRNISILFTALCTGIILFAGVSLAVNRFNGPFIPENNFSYPGLGVLVIFTVICLYLAHFNYNKQMRPELLTQLSLPKKLDHYRSALIKYMAFLEGPAILSIIAFLLTGYFRFLAITFILLLNMYLKRPSKMRMSNDLKLSSNEQSELYM